MTKMFYRLSHFALRGKMKRNLLLISSSRVHGYSYLEVAEDEIKHLLSSNGAKSVLFIPYASNKYDQYFDLVSPVFKTMGYEMVSIHHHENAVEAVANAEAIFVGGGNTFLLLKTLYEKDLIKPLQSAVLINGTPYIGSSAGTNIATQSINTTNDMPIVHPPSFEALKLVPFNINPHYLETDVNSTHKGETRDQRINEYLEMPLCNSVLGLREGSMLRVTGQKAILKGIMGARLFDRGTDPKEFEVNSDLSFLLKI